MSHLEYHFLQQDSVPVDDRLMYALLDTFILLLMPRV